jgi:hypothetical protein
MTKARIAIYVAIFAAFSMIGIVLAYQFRDHILFPVSGEKAASAPVMARSQQNLLVIHIDELNKPNPKLISVWVVFFAQHDRTFVSFKALHPDPLSPNPIIPVNVLFSLDENGAPSEAFLYWVRKHHLEWSAFVLIDQEGLEQISRHLQSGALDFIIPRSKDQRLTVWQQEAGLMNRLCLQMQENERTKNKFDWDGLIPHHMRSDLTFENAILMWNKIAPGNDPPYCEVYGLN